MTKNRCARRLFVCVLSALMLFVSGTGCDSSGQVTTFSQIEITPNTTTVDLSGTIDYTVTIVNTGEGRDLTINDIVLDYTPLDDAEIAAGAAFTLIKQTPLPATIAANAGASAEDIVTFIVRYKTIGDLQDRTASVTILNDNTQSEEKQNLKIDFSGRRCRPILDVDDNVDFGTVGFGASNEVEISLTNTGSCALEIDWISVEGPNTFSVTAGGQEYIGSPDYQQYILPEVVVVAPGDDLRWMTKFVPLNGEPSAADLVIHTNNQEVTDGIYKVALLGNATGPLLRVVPAEADFGGKLLGKAAGMTLTLSSVGTSDVKITSLVLGEGTSPDFTLDASGLGVIPTAEAPLVLSPGSNREIVLKFTPDVENPRDNANKPIPDTGTLDIASNVFEMITKVPISGYGVTVECPKPVIVIEEGEVVQPQTVLHIHGDQSQSGSAGGTIISYSWTVDQPPENKFILLPTASSENVTHEVNIGGKYTYCLDVCDGQYCSSDAQCGGAVCKEVLVVPDKAIHCELTWHTPGDLDEFDEGEDVGTDMDLHFTHPFAAMNDLDGDGKPDPWFHNPYDCFWFQKTPEWETANPDGKDNPSLDRDDTDGAGPENVNLDTPVSGRVYRIGVHYWDDHGLGASYPRLKCYIWGQAVFDLDLRVTDTKMYKCDMWYAAEISWPQQVVTQIKNTDGTLKITHSYEEPSFSEIGGGGCSAE